MTLDANKLSNIIPKVLARGLIVLRETCIMPRLVNSDYSVEAARKGSMIEIPVPVAQETQPVTPLEVHTEESVGVETPVVEVKLDNWRETKPMHLRDDEMEQIDYKENWLPIQLEEGVRALAHYVNRQILTDYLGIYGYYGTAGTTPFATDVKDATNARKILNKQLCPKSNRRGVLDFDAEANALALAQFSDAEKIMSAAVKLEGEIGRKFGIDWAADDDVPTHTAGSMSLVAVDHLAVGTAGEVGDKILEIIGDATSKDATIFVGDIITITNDPDDDDQTYVVAAGVDGEDGYVAATKTYTIPDDPWTIVLTIEPGLAQIADTGGKIVVEKTHICNLVFHRNAFAFATRSLDSSDALAKVVGGSQIISMQDAKTGLVLRLEVSRRHRMFVWNFDILFGHALVRPELAMRLVG